MELSRSLPRCRPARLPVPAFIEVAYQKIVESRIFGFARKEFLLQNATSFTLLNRLLIGPIISFATTGILYKSFFNINPKSPFGELSGSNYLPYVVMGFLLHTYLNTGYYCFFAKLNLETFEKNLYQIWLAPTSRVFSFFSLAAVDIVRTFCVLVLALLICNRPTRPWAEAISIELLLFLLFLPFCLLLGVFRNSMRVLYPSVAECLDHVYMAMVMLACPYIPKSIFPPYVRWTCQYNPAYYMGQLLREGWHPTGTGMAPPLMAFLGIAGLLILAFYFFVRRNRDRITELTLSV